MSNAKETTSSNNAAPEQQNAGNNGKEITSAGEQAGAEAATTRPGGSGGGFIGYLALIVAIGAILVSYTVWQQFGGSQESFIERMDSVESAIGNIQSSAQAANTAAETAQSSSQSTQDQFTASHEKTNSRLQEIGKGLDDIKAQQQQLNKAQKTAATEQQTLAAAQGKLGNQQQTLAKTQQTLESKLAKVSSELGKLEKVAQLEGNLQGLEDSISALRATIEGDAAAGYLAAEARHLIRMADYQARINRDAKAAVAALEAADQRLQQIGDPSLIDVRKLITDDIIALRGMEALDLAGVAQKISALEAEVEGLPIKTDRPVQVASADTEETGLVTGIGDFASQVWGDVRGLVTIRHNSDSADAAVFLPPGQRFFLAQNLRLKLEAARLALLQRDTATFHTSLITTRQWLEIYFNTDAANTANVLTTLAPYESLDLNPTLPDVTRALPALDAWEAQRNGNAHQTTATGEVSQS